MNRHRHDNVASFDKLAKALPRQLDKKRSQIKPIPILIAQDEVTDATLITKNRAKLLPWTSSETLKARGFKLRTKGLGADLAITEIPR